MDTTTVQLTPKMFSQHEQQLLQVKDAQGQVVLAAFTFRFASGVCAVRLENAVGSLVMLPFQGQQIWSAEFAGRKLTMKSMCRQPRPGVPFLETFGGFLQHCGATAMGGPSAKDTHPLHGELPNAPYQEAFLELGQDKRGAYLGLGGSYQHTVAFSFNYLAEPRVRLYAGSTLFEVEMTVTNLKNTPMELMYLAHINFKPVDYARLVYSVPYSPEHVRVRSSIPSHIQPLPGYAEFLQELTVHPEKHHVLLPELKFDPEVAIFLDYVADAQGWAHSLQIHPDGGADYVAHRPQELPRATRWLCRTPDQDALALIEPGTAEPEGYLAEKAKGHLQVLPPQGKFHAQVIVGTLNQAEAAQTEKMIHQVAGRG